MFALGNAGGRAIIRFQWRPFNAMFMSLLGKNLIMLALTTVAFWWLSGFDSLLSGTSRLRDLTRRALRCGASLVIVESICFPMRSTLITTLPLRVTFVWS